MQITSSHGKNFKILKRLSNGAFGRVYECQESDSDQILVVKIIQGQSMRDTVCEIKLMQKLSGKQYFPKFIDWGQGFNGHEMIQSVEEPYYSFIVQEKLGESLKDLKLRNQGSLELVKVCQIGIDLINALQQLHSMGFLHRDIKPDNILLGLNDGKAHLIDFGMARQFTSKRPDGQMHHIQNFRIPFEGNEFWSSKWLMLENTPSRRDDIISTIYSLVFLMDGYRHIFRQGCVETFIRDSSASQFCEGAEALVPLLEEAYSYNFDETPNYNKLMSILQKVINDEEMDKQYNGILLEMDEKIEDVSQKVYITQTHLNHIIFGNKIEENNKHT